jgi:hypothetical protein
MKLQDVFDQLTAGEFSQLSIAGEAAGVINDKNYKTVLAHVNLGLTTLYRRFNLKEGRLTLALQPGQAQYQLSSAFAAANRRSREVLRYIEDTAAAPFQDDIHKVERVLTEFGSDMPVNDAADEYSCMTPSLTMLVMPDKVVNQDSNTPFWLRINKATVVYRANHPIIAVPFGTFDPARAVLELPYSHLEALLYFVASRVNNPIGMSNEFHAGNNYAAKFEAACQALENAGIQVDRGTHNTRASLKGFP